jgi:hypothetical protein
MGCGDSIAHFSPVSLHSTHTAGNSNETEYFSSLTAAPDALAMVILGHDSIHSSDLDARMDTTIVIQLWNITMLMEDRPFRRNCHGMELRNQ